MKKLSVLIALALCLTIGGAYAGWVYFEGDVTSAEVSQNIQMDVQGSTSALGTYTFETYPMFSVDPESATNFTTKLVTDGTEIMIKLVVEEEAGPTLLANGKAPKIKITLGTTNGTINLDDYIKVIDAEIEVNTKTGSNGEFYYTLKADDLLACFDLVEKELPTKAEAEAYEAIIETISIKLEAVEQ